MPDAGPDTVTEAMLARLDAVPALASRTEVSDLSGGLTNRNLKVTTPEGVFVARLSSPESALLAIDRDAEHANSVAAAASGAAPDVIAFAPEVSVLVVRFVDGSTWSPSDVLEPQNAPRAAEALRMLHAGPRFANDFDMLRLQPQYLALCQERGFRLPDRYLDFADHASAIADALAVRPVPTVPCNNDLLAANVIDTGDRVWLIDYEYSGNNDPFFEVGNLWSEATGTPDDLERLVTAYVGEPSRALTARARLWGLMSKYGWMLWASIQDGTSDLDFDFWAWGMEKYDRAVEEFDGPDFGRLLEEVRTSA
ncbi:phosphotransferase [Longivirga aurantiaca]|uniref:Phosphotransferase n=1 Tax=Longivirga aurantiaca TaxID=1837743 RepID=A0ABW1T0X3_9ACTN